MFGFACTETPTLMPAPIYYAHQLMQRQSLVRKNGTLTILRPDAKSQVTLVFFIALLLVIGLVGAVFGIFA